MVGSLPSLQDASVRVLFAPLGDSRSRSSSGERDGSSSLEGTNARRTLACGTGTTLLVQVSLTLSVGLTMREQEQRGQPETGSQVMRDQRSKG